MARIRGRIREQFCRIETDSGRRLAPTPVVESTSLRRGTLLVGTDRVLDGVVDFKDGEQLSDL